jgi:hypothetical protein
MHKPASVEQYVVAHGPFDPPLNDDEKAAIQKWIAGETDLLFLRCKFETDPAAARIAELESKLEDFQNLVREGIELVDRLAHHNGDLTNVDSWTDRAGCAARGQPFWVKEPK